MARINLLPWREEIRKQRQRRFYMALGATALAAAFVVGAVVILFIGLINNQQKRNDYLNAEIRKVEAEIRRIEQLEEKRDQVLARIEVLEQLQRDRTLSVHLFDQLVRTAPTGVHLNSIEQQGNQLTIRGLTQSSSRVSNYLSRLESSEWLHDPDLRIVEADDPENDPDSRYNFRIQAQLRSPHDPRDGFDDEV